MTDDAVAAAVLARYGTTFAGSYAAAPTSARPYPITSE